MYKRKLKNTFQKLNIECRYWKIGLICLLVLLEIISIVCLINDSFNFPFLGHYIENNNVILIISIVLLFLTSTYTKKVIKKEILMRCLKEYKSDRFTNEKINQIMIDKFCDLVEELQPFEDNSKTNITRENRRKFLIYIVGILGIFCFILSLRCIEITILIGGVSICVIIYIYADYLPHANYYAKQYDKKNGGRKGNAIRGLAKIYQWEYKKTRFNENDDFYKESKIYSPECIRYILNVVYRDEHSRWTIINNVLLLTNIMILFVGYSKNIFQISAEYFHIVNIMSYDIIQIIITIVANTITIVQLLIQDQFYENMTKIAFYSYYEGEKNILDEFYSELKEEGKYLNDILLVRGIFLYNSSVFDKGGKIESINEDDRMLFIHKAIANRPRLKITIFCVSLLIMSAMMFLGMGLLQLLGICCLGIISYKVCKVFLLPCIGRKKIIKEINKL